MFLWDCNIKTFKRGRFQKSVRALVLLPEALCASETAVAVEPPPPLSTCFATVLFAFVSAALFDLTTPRVSKWLSACPPYSLLQALHTAASSTPLARSGLCTWAQRTPFLKPMMEGSKTSSRISLRSKWDTFLEAASSSLRNYRSRPCNKDKQSRNS